VDFEDLIDFIDNRMKMSHIYQPLMLRILVEAGGSATIRQIAQGFLAQDESQLRYYENRIKQMPLPVLRRRGVISNKDELVTLNCNKLTFEQKAQVVMSCEKRLQRFIINRGIDLWGYRLLDTDPVPGSLRYRVLKESGGRCALCGATKKERPLDVDHIIPRSRGGRTFMKIFKFSAPCATRKRETKTTPVSVMTFLQRRFPAANSATRISRRGLSRNLTLLLPSRISIP
jgi:ATP adenylyltransferase